MPFAEKTCPFSIFILVCMNIKMFHLSVIKEKQNHSIDVILTGSLATYSIKINPYISLNPGFENLSGFMK